MTSRSEWLLDMAQRLLDRGPGQDRRSRAGAIVTEVRRQRRKPPESGIAVPAVPPKGPLPMQGGAEAPLTFD